MQPGVQPALVPLDETGVYELEQLIDNSSSDLWEPFSPSSEIEMISWEGFGGVLDILYSGPVKSKRNAFKTSVTKN